MLPPMQNNIGLIIGGIISGLSLLSSILLGIKIAIKSSCCSCKEKPIKNENTP